MVQRRKVDRHSAAGAHCANLGAALPESIDGLVALDGLRHRVSGLSTAGDHQTYRVSI